MDTSISENESLFTELWKELHECKSLSDLQSFQSSLIEETVYAQLAIRHYRRSIQDVNRLRESLARKKKQSKGAQFLDSQYEEHFIDVSELLQEVEERLRLIQLLGDTLAWQLFPRFAIRSFYRDESPGYMIDKIGTILELDIVEKLKSDGFVFMHDLTSIIREFDLSVHGGRYDGLLIEAKTSGSVGESLQQARQKKRARDSVDYVNTGTKKLDDGFTLNRIPHEVDEHYEWDVIEKCLRDGKDEGLAVTKSSDGLAFYIGATINGLEELEPAPNRFHQLRLNAGFKSGTVPKDVLNLPRDLPLLPLTNSTITPDLITDILFRRLFLFVSIDQKGINKAFKSTKVKLTMRSKGTKPAIIGPNNERLELGLYHYERILHEGLSPSSFVSICVAQFDKVDTLTK